MSDVLLIKSVDALIACKELGELAAGLAQLAQRLLDPREVHVVLRSPEGGFPGGAANGDATGLERWAEGLISARPAPGLVREARFVAAAFEADGVDVRGVVAARLPDGGTEDERPLLLTALADLAATCSAQLLHRILADRALQDTRAAMARGLHDLCTPLNSLRLGMHLLEPALTAKDPVVAQRAHRAVDRMAALVTTMADALGKPEGGARTLHPS